MNTMVKPDPKTMTPPEFRAFVIQNLQRAIQIMQAVPAEHVDLDSFKCGSTACLAGWLCSDPYFAQWMALVPRKHNLQVSVETRERHAFMLTRRTVAMAMEEPIECSHADFSDLFGWDAGLFNQSYGDPQVQHKNIALRRLQNWLSEVEQKKHVFGGIDPMEDDKFQELSLGAAA